MNFGVKSQLDTSMYNRGGTGTSIGEALGVFQGIQSIAGRARENKLKRKDEEEIAAIDSAFSKSLQGADLNNREDVAKRLNAGAGELLTTMPSAYSKVTSELGKAMKSLADQEDQELQSEAKRLENEGKTTANEGAKIDVAKKGFDAQKSFHELQHWRASKLSELLSGVKDEQSYNNAVLSAQYLDIPAKLPDFATFSKNPNGYMNQVEAEKAQHEKTMKEYGAEKAKSDATVSDVNAKYAEQEKLLDLNKKRSEAQGSEDQNLDIEYFADEIASGRLAPSDLKSFFPAGIMGTKARSEAVVRAAQKFKDQNPDEVFNVSKLNRDWQVFKSAPTIKALQAVETFLPNLDRLQVAIEQLPADAKLGALNKILQKAEVQFGNQAATNVDMLRGVLAHELGSSLGGGTALSDERIKMALNALNTTSTKETALKALDMLREVEVNRHVNVAMQGGVYGRNYLNDVYGKETADMLIENEHKARKKVGRQVTGQSEVSTPAQKPIKVGESFTNKNGVKFTRIED